MGNAMPFFAAIVAQSLATNLIYSSWAFGASPLWLLEFSLIFLFTASIAINPYMYSSVKKFDYLT